jgi:hypothetical protein
MGKIDLHTHTTASDGMYASDELVRMAKERGLTAVAITDHDTVSGIQSANMAGQKYNVEVVPGIEVSTVYQGKEIHVLGYFVDFTSKAFLNDLIHLREGRHRRNQMLIKRLNELGIAITLDEVAAKQTDPNGNVGRPHFAQVLVDKKVVNTIQEAFDFYLGEGGKAYVSTPRISPEEGVQLIVRHGGIPVLAHPGLYHDDSLISQLMPVGLKGIEVYHPDHSPEDLVKYKDLALRYQLLATGGSDFHGMREKGPYHGALGSQPVGVDALEQLKSLRNKKRA